MARKISRSESSPGSQQPAPTVRSAGRSRRADRVTSELRPVRLPPTSWWTGSKNSLPGDEAYPGRDLEIESVGRGHGEVRMVEHVDVRPHVLVDVAPDVDQALPKATP
jgi:hypothetical protein